MLAASLAASGPGATTSRSACSSRRSGGTAEPPDEVGSGLAAIAVVADQAVVGCHGSAGPAGTPGIAPTSWLTPAVVRVEAFPAAPADPTALTPGPRCCAASCDWGCLTTPARTRPRTRKNAITGSRRRAKERNLGPFRLATIPTTLLGIMPDLSPAGKPMQQPDSATGGIPGTDLIMHSRAACG